ncbi:MULTISPECIES: carboxymuconolactone decarboxylase family protein [unclassified Burkholderia]|uniref:carboxymuconolactone decarboxylase family protein n=1 Tax=unclassified Burkholderia TaxID=2613784 RepID=UPI00084CE1D4|nr:MULTISPECIES: carboxymuconolactone decarboxylase family protein [unclassified Burkholderia]RQU06269.1 carboxymuconolactone decarboxylase family protein [Burkholderia cenocepacia]MBR8238433.1 carboxymuconolactone decarboxylase family protein [Burkholderia sp. AU32357]MBY4876099.1 carboxymuconolactone decarboxylase family protein [Burkholderia sp. AU42008]OED08003.1 4-carboxymuconolactone decarboxylase [Burkholderia sp. A2]OXI38872.1 4-carboxymuconolactone decarboxylase [Burkholderia sp. AU17
MSHTHFDSPREAARAFTPTLAAFVDDTLYPRIWSDPALAPRDRSLVTVAALIAGGHLDELPAHLRRALANGVTREALSAAITHLAFYAGFPAAISASAVAQATLGAQPRSDDLAGNSATTQEGMK